MTNLLLVGHNRIFRQALGIVLRGRVPSCSILAEAGTPGEAAHVLAQGIPIDVTVFDHDSRADDAADVVELMNRLWRDRPGSAILALVDAAQRPRLVYPSGAETVRVLDTSASLDEILSAIQDLACTVAGTTRSPRGSHGRAHRTVAAAVRFRLRVPRRYFVRPAGMHSGQSAPECR